VVILKLGMDVENRDSFRRMAEAQERIASVLEKQQPGKLTQAITIGATVATVLGILSVIDIVAKWMGGQ
jgi:hypothetical protein